MTTSRAAHSRRAVRVLIVDRHDVVRRGVRGVLTAAPGIRVVAEASTVEEARCRMVALRPDVVLTDARLPDGTAVDVCRQARAVHPLVRVVVVTAHVDADAVYEAILAGVCGYLLVDITGDALVDAVRRVAAGQSLLDPAVTGRLLDRLRHVGSGPSAPALPEELAVLTVQERRILDLIVDGLTNREIGALLAVSEQTVKNHVTSILAKLGVTRRTQAAALGSRLRGRRDGAGTSAPSTARPVTGG